MALNFPGNEYMQGQYPSVFSGMSQTMSPQVAAQYSQARVQNTAVTPGQPQQANNNSGSAITDASKLSKLGGLGTSLDVWGAKNLGLGTVSYSGIGPGSLPWNQPGMATGALNAGEAGTAVSGGLGSILGGAGFGFGAGGLIGKWVGGNPMGSSIGGAIGGALGAATGISSGIAMGATLGSVVPGLGTVIGAIGGSLLGGMFGGGKPHPASGYSGGIIAPDGTFVGGKLGAKHVPTSLASGMRDQFSTYMQNQAEKYGIKYGKSLGVAIGYDPGMFGGAGSRINIATTGADGKRINKAFNFDMNDPASRKAAYENAFKYTASASGIDPTKLKPSQASNITLNLPKMDGLAKWNEYLNTYRTEHGSPTA